MLIGLSYMNASGASGCQNEYYFEEGNECIFIAALLMKVHAQSATLKSQSFAMHHLARGMTIVEARGYDRSYSIIAV